MHRSALIEIAVVLHTPGKRITSPKTGAGLDPGTQLDPIRYTHNPSSLDKHHVTNCRGGVVPVINHPTLHSRQRS